MHKWSQKIYQIQPNFLFSLTKAEKNEMQKKIKLNLDCQNQTEV